MKKDHSKRKKRQGSVWARISYHFDNIMAGGTAAKILLLLAFTILVVILLGFILFLIGGVSEHSDFGSSVWISLMHTFDPGTLGGDEDRDSVLAILLVATLFGMFFTAILIGIINTGIEERMDRLSRGRSKVLESNHTIILGFNQITSAIISQLIEANANQPGRQVVVVMDQTAEKTEMEETIHRHLSRSLIDFEMEDKMVGKLDKLFVIEEDDNPIQCVPKKTNVSTEFVKSRQILRLAGHLVIVGVGPLINDVLEELDGFLQENTNITVVDSSKRLDRAGRREYSGVNIEYVEADPDDYIELEKAIPEDTASVLVLARNSVGFGADSDNLEKMELSDEKILARLLFLRQIRESRGTYFNITCEMNMDQNRKLAEYTNHEDFIVGSSITAMIITQIAETRELHRAFHEILDANGSELYMRRAGISLGFHGTRTMDLYTVQAIMAQQNEVFIGIREHIGSSGYEYKIPIINPSKWTCASGQAELKQYTLHEDDMLVVIAPQ